MDRYLIGMALQYCQLTAGYPSNGIDMNDRWSVLMYSRCIRINPTPVAVAGFGPYI